MLGQLGSLTSPLSSFLTWVVREHCDRHPEAVVHAWEKLDPENPTLADAGRMFAAYGIDFSELELRFIGTHPEALRLARAAAAGRHHLIFKTGPGFVATSAFERPPPGSIGWAAVTLVITAIVALTLALYNGVLGNIKLAGIFGFLCAVTSLLTSVEFADRRSLHRAARAIDLCEDHNTIGTPTVKVVDALPAILENAERPVETDQG